jgi:hypothetical protein
MADSLQFDHAAADLLRDGPLLGERSITVRQFKREREWPRLGCIHSEVMCVLRTSLSQPILFELQTIPTTHKDRVRTSHPLSDYKLVNLVAYTLYPPLYIAGPIMTFNDFIWQVSTASQFPGIATRKVDSAKTDSETHPTDNEKSIILCCSVLVLSFDNGNRSTFHVRRSHQRHWVLERQLSGRTQHDWILESDRSLVKGWLNSQRKSFCTWSNRSHIQLAADTLEVLPLVGISGRNGPSREHGSMYGQQLLMQRVLAELAP